jgi:hypothetical protein
MTFQPPTKPSNAAMPALYLLFSSLHLEKHNRAIIDKLASVYDLNLLPFLPTFLPLHFRIPSF